jgi:hypothetical protein
MYNTAHGKDAMLRPRTSAATSAANFGRELQIARGGGGMSNFRGMKQERATYVVCDQCQNLFKAGTFKDGTTPTACPTCRVGVDPAGQTVTIDTESRF